MEHNTVCAESSLGILALEVVLVPGVEVLVDRTQVVGVLGGSDIYETGLTVPNAALLAGLMVLCPACMEPGSWSRLL